MLPSSGRNTNYGSAVPSRLLNAYGQELIPRIENVGGRKES